MSVHGNDKPAKPEVSAGNELIAVRGFVRRKARPRGTAKRLDALAEDGYGAKWPRKRKRPSKQQRQVVRAVAEQLASSPNAVYATLRLTHIQSALTDALAKAGLTPERMASVLADAVGAVKTIVGGSRMAPAVVEVPDHPTRLAAYDRVVAAHGLVPKVADLPEPPAPPVSITFHRAGGSAGEQEDAAAIPQNVTIIIAKA